MRPVFPWITIWPDALFLTMKRAPATASFCVEKNAPVLLVLSPFTAHPLPDGTTCTVLAIASLLIVPEPAGIRSRIATRYGYDGDTVQDALGTKWGQTHFNCADVPGGQCSAPFLIQ